MTTLFTYRPKKTPHAEAASITSQSILLAFCTTVLIGMALCVVFIARRPSSSVASATRTIKSGWRGVDRDTDARVRSVETRRANDVWIVLSVPDPPAPNPPSVSPEVQELASQKRDLKRAPLNLDIFALQDAWVEVQTDGHLTYAKLVRAEQTLSFQASERIRILAGNASNVELRFNGRPVPPSVTSRRVRCLEFTTEGSRELNSDQQVARS
jgi:hypothetical protein